jgi:hypothetical protein
LGEGRKKKKMFLIDSSVWVEYLHPKGAKKVKEVLFHLLKPVIDIQPRFYYI